MRNFLVLIFLMAWVLPFGSLAHAQNEQSQSTTDEEQSQASGYGKKVVILSEPTAYDKLTAQQKERVDRVLALFELPPEDRPRASERLKYHPAMAVATALGSNTQVKDIDCVLDEYSVGCWFDGETYCGIIWAEGSRPAAEVGDDLSAGDEQELEIGCW